VQRIGVRARDPQRHADAERPGSGRSGLRDAQFVRHVHLVERPGLLLVAHAPRHQLYFFATPHDGPARSASGRLQDDRGQRSGGRLGSTKKESSGC